MPAPSFGILAKPSCDFVSVHTRQSDVHQHDFRTEPPNRLERLLAVVADFDIVAIQLQDHGQALCGRDVVVNHQDASRRRA